MQGEGFARLDGMPMGILVMVFVLVFMGAILMIVVGFAQAKKRREALAGLATSLGFSFDPSRDSRHDDEYRHFSIFRKGHGRVAFNTMRGEIEIEGRRFAVKMGDFRYRVTSGSGKNRSTRTYTLSYLIAHQPFVTPDLLIRPENALDKLAGIIGFDDIDFESEEFSRRFLVKSGDRRFAYDTIDPRMMEFLLGSAPPSIDIEQGRCLLYRSTRCWTPQRFRDELRWLTEFFSRWPDHVTRSLDSSSTRNNPGA